MSFLTMRYFLLLPSPCYASLTTELDLFPDDWLVSARDRTSGKSSSISWRPKSGEVLDSMLRILIGNFACSENNGFY